MRLKLRTAFAACVGLLLSLVSSLGTANANIFDVFGPTRPAALFLVS
jgi:hypothetical protein